MRVRPINSKKYNISAHRFMEMFHFCLQYNEWKDELKYNTDSVKSIEITDMPGAHNTKDVTQELAMKRAELKEKCELIEQTVREAGGDIYEYLLKAVTNEGITYNYLNMIMKIPCSKNTYYDRRRKFYYLLSKKNILKVWYSGDKSI